MLRNIISTYIARISSLLLNFLTNILIARAVGPEGRGFIAFASSLASFWASSGSFGINLSNFIFGAKWTDKRSHLVGNSIAISLYSTLFLLLVLSLGKIICPQLIYLPGVFFLGAIFYTLALMLLTNLQALLFAFDKVKICNIQEVVSKVLILAGCLILCYLHWQSPGKIFITLVTITLIASFYYIYACYKFLAQKPQVSWQIFKDSISFNFRAFLFMTTSNIFLFADTFLVTHLCGPSQAGLYNIAIIMRSFFLTFVGVITQLLLPKVSQHKVIREAIPEVLRVSFITTAVGITLLIITAIISPVIIPMVLGQEFASSATMFIWIAPGVLFFCNYNILLVIFNLSGLPNRSIISIMLASVLNLVLCYLFIHQDGGAIGACQAFSVTSLLLDIVTWIQILALRKSPESLQEIASVQ